MNVKEFIQDRFRTVLSDKTIMSMNSKGLLLETPITGRQLQPNSVDLTLADTWKKPKPNAKYLMKEVIDPSLEIEYEEGIFAVKDPDDPISMGKKIYLLMPGEFVLMASREILNIPNGILAFVQGRSSMARIGIQTEQAGLIDAGFRGTITFEVYNETRNPIILYEGMRVAQLYFYKAQRASKEYGSIGKGSKYQMQIEATGSKIHQDPELH